MGVWDGVTPDQVKHLMGVVDRQAAIMRLRGVGFWEYEDMRADGLAALTGALQAFNPDHPRADLDSWVAWRARGAMIDGLRHRNHYRGSRDTHHRVVFVDPAVLSLECDLRGVVTADHTGTARVADELVGVLRRMPVGERVLLLDVYLHEYSMMDISGWHGCDQSRVWQVVKAARDRARDLAADLGVDLSRFAGRRFAWRHLGVSPTSAGWDTSHLATLPYKTRQAKAA